MIFFAKFKTVLGCAVGLTTALLLSSCSISNSVGSTSDSAGSVAKSSESISESSTSISKSSQDDTTPQKSSRYEQDTQEFTVNYLRANAGQTEPDSFMKGMSQVATRHGIVDWEANLQTYQAIGKGLQQAKLAAGQFEQAKRALANGDSSKLAALQQGYHH